MTLIVALLRSEGMSPWIARSCYVELGVATVVSARIWSRFLDRAQRRGVSDIQIVAGACGAYVIRICPPPMADRLRCDFRPDNFLSAVASTTVLMRQIRLLNVVAGFAHLRCVFAFGQIGKAGFNRLGVR